MKALISRAFNGIFLAPFLGMLVGCGSASKVSDLSASINPDIAAGKVRIPPESAVSIQYPMVLSESAKGQLVGSYACKYNDLINHPAGSCGNSGFTGSAAPRLAEQSTYYAAEIKELLGSYIDRKNIFLEPFYVDYQDGEFRERPLLSVNAPTTIAVKVYDFPSSYRSNIGAGPLIFANIRTAGSASPATCGQLFMAGGEYVGTAKPQQSCAHLDARQVPSTEPLRFFGEKELDVENFPQQKDKPIAPGTLLGIGALYQENDDEYLKRSSEASFEATAKSIQGPEVAWLARAAANALRVVDTQAAFDAGFAVYLQDYDAGLASRFAQRALQPGDDRKIAVARKLLDAERDWLASQNAAITDGILNGNYGKSFRQSRWVMAQAYNKAQALEWLSVGAMLIGGFSSGLFGGAGAYNPSMLMMTTLQNEQRFSAMQNQIEQTLLESLAPGVEMRSKVVQVSLDGLGSTPVSGASHGEIRAQLLALYKKLSGT